MTVLRVLISLSFLTLLGACVTDGEGLPNVACAKDAETGRYKTFAPITYSRIHDTRPTVRQIVAHNAVGKKLCGWKSR